MDTSMLIGAAFESGADAEEQVLNPRTGGLIKAIPEASLAQVDRAVTAAGKAFAHWSRTRLPPFSTDAAARATRQKVSSKVTSTGAPPAAFRRYLASQISSEIRAGNGDWSMRTISALIA